MRASGLPLPQLEKDFRAWLMVGAGLLVLYIPAYVELFLRGWRHQEAVYGYVIFAVCLWLFWTSWPAARAAPGRGAMLGGGVSLLLGLLIQIFGRSQDVLALEIVSQVPVILGLLLCLGGAAFAYRFRFALLFLLFLTPVPPALLEVLTAPLKQLVSAVTETVLYWAGYPIARSGVVLQVGVYRMLVADACSGLNSIVSLHALGLIYLYCMRHKSALRNVLLFASVLPIAIAANIVRVLLLVLITFHFGHDAGQGFVHGAASIALLLTALSLFLFTDTLIGWIIARRWRS